MPTMMMRPAAPLLLIAVSCLTLATVSQARTKRCYVCRSRGVLGDCRDPFYQNATLIAAGSNRAIEAAPCPSGWCGKAVEGNTETDHVAATERMCLQRPPQDGQERCSETFYEKRSRPIFMCFCKGDLCNDGIKLAVWPRWTIGVALLLFRLVV